MKMKRGISLGKFPKALPLWAFAIIQPQSDRMFPFRIFDKFSELASVSQY